MPLVVPDAGERQLLTELLSSGENWLLRLYTNNLALGEAAVAADFTEAAFAGYAAKALTRTVTAATWSTPTTAGGVTAAQYAPAAPQSWTPGAAATVYGYLLVGAVSGIVVGGEYFGAAGIALTAGVPFTIVPKMQLD